MFDFRNESLQRWFIDGYMEAALAPSSVDGVILDDAWSMTGPSEEDRHALEDAGLGVDDVSALVAGWTAVRAALDARVTKLHKYIAPTYGGDALSWYKHAPAASPTDCAAKLRKYCGPNSPAAAPHYFSVGYEKIPAPAFGLKPVNMDLDM